MTVINSIRKQNAKKNLKISKKQNKRSIWIHLKIKKVADVKFRHQKSYGMFLFPYLYLFRTLLTIISGSICAKHL